jgi:hypothetical protein
MQLSTPAGNVHQSGAEQTGQLRGDPPAHVTAPPQVSAGQNQTPVGQRAGEQAVSDPAIPGQLLDRRKMRGPTGATGSPNSRTSAETRRNFSDKASQNPADAQARGNGQAATGADVNQPAQSTQAPDR